MLLLGEFEYELKALKYIVPNFSLKTIDLNYLVQ